GLIKAISLKIADKSDIAVIKELISIRQKVK
ncbi:MAG: hypothetical protein H6Q23_1849, partial [Bacteroidetes bacterium]|nr:hypothetical protein [Bacteroidota bacterium]